ncbi:polysaccharide biosynthesis protein [Salicibibacter halophilus]|uniref:Polysaccharide biosynthesis protein n=1 Tax=Salicibibacter halophilus TaxID=2502791 RepID=A0A514LHA6_9BACI|nr:polysaccharide biosynthesis protein [Salicibibacter halophilus]QDI91230.1 polysaccharide biosynthesis protein [Salicibibacter halophilus]
MSDTKLVRGTMLLTGATITSKLLGVLYIFPFTLLVGQQGNALYQYGYLPYTILLSLATLGVPMAVSKFVSKYNALDDYVTGQRLFRSGVVFMTITGFIAFLGLFIMAPVIAGWVLPSGDSSGNSHSDVVFTIRMVSFALLIIPGMAVFRGYFQGFQSMGPTAASQVIEQLARIIFILAAAFLVLEVFGGSLGLAVGLATFGALIGGLGSLSVLLYFWKKRKAGIQEQIRESKKDHQLPLSSMYKELIAYALPLSFVGLAIPLFQAIDLFTFNDAMTAGYGANAGQAETAFGAFSRTTHALIMIPVALATAMSVNLIPAITKANTNRDTESMHRLITKTFQIILFFTIPAAFGLTILATPAFASLYGLEDLGVGSMVLSYYAPAAILFSIFAVTAAILQGMNRQKYAVIGLCIGLFFKLVLNYWLISSFGAVGGVAATIIGYTLAIGFNIWAVGKFAAYQYTQIGKHAAVILGITAIMAVSVYIVREGGMVVFDTSGQTGFVAILVFGVLIGMLLYFILSIRTGMAEKVLGDRFSFSRLRR